METRQKSFFNKKTLYKLILIVLCLGLNLFLSFLARRFNYRYFPLYLDCVGTALATMLGGVLPGVIVGFSTNAINSLFASNITLYYGTISVIFALLFRLCFMRGHLNKFYKRALSSLVISVICGSLGGVLTWLVYGLDIGVGEMSAPLACKMIEAWSLPPFAAQVLAEVFIDIADKLIVVFAAWLLFIVCPKKIKKALDSADPFSEEKKTGKSSLRFFHTITGYVVFVMLLFDVILCTTVAAVSYYMYQDTCITKYSQICDDAVNVAMSMIDPDMINGFKAERDKVGKEFFAQLPEEAREYSEEYMEYYLKYWDFSHERYSDGYRETENKLIDIFDVYQDLEYLYVYSIEEDGCHVIFDVDTTAYDYLVPFEESFEEHIPTLLQGGKIDPIISDDTYGWLLSVYEPMFDMHDECVCYVCADISMNDLRVDQMKYIVKVIVLVTGLSIVAMAIIIDIFDKKTVIPIKKISAAASDFAFDTEKGQHEGIERVKGLQIDSCDEIDQLYDSLKKMATDSVNYIDKLEDNAKTIARMQEGIIMDFANMVENRDKSTGDHIKKTSYYVEHIAKELKKEGEYADTLTDEFISSIIRSAPLHDIGKIKISDVILNKPGKLTEEEYAIMKTHTTAGYEILNAAITNTLNSEYLKEAMNMAYCHHEKWDGSGYPRGLKGEEIPLSARIMAVADVFDALVSKRSYKGPFPFEDAVAIIRDGAGRHFDPVTVKAFLNIAESFRNEI